jgi:hypothetical protein
MDAPAFRTFWKVYPRKKNKQAAEDAFRWAFQHFNGDGQLLEKLLQSIAWQEQEQPDPQYWKYPDKWLLARRWEDEPDAPPKAKVKPLSEFEQQRLASHSRAVAQQVEYARKRQEAS